MFRLSTLVFYRASPLESAGKSCHIRNAAHCSSKLFTTYHQKVSPSAKQCYFSSGIHFLSSLYSVLKSQLMTIHFSFFWTYSVLVFVLGLFALHSSSETAKKTRLKHF